MDSFFSLGTPSPIPFSIQFPDFPNPTPIATVTSSETTPIPNGTTFPNLLVPKPEPFDEFAVNHHDFQQQQQQQPLNFFVPNGSDADHELDLYDEFYRVSELFNATFGKEVESLIGAENGNVYSDVNNVVVLESEPNPNPNLNLNLNLNDSNLNSQSCDGNDLAIVPVPEEQESTRAVAVVKRKGRNVKELVRVTDLTIKDQIHFRDGVRRTRMIYDSLRVLASVEEEKRAATEREEEEKRVAAERAEEEKRAAAAAEGVGDRVEEEIRVVEMETRALEEEIRVVAEELRAAVEPGMKRKLPRRRRSRIRGDLRAAALMRERGLWLNREKRIVGEIPGVYVGDLFLFRMELLVLGLHHQIQAGIDYLPMSMSSNGEPIATSVIVSGGYEDDMDDGEVIIYTGHGGQGKNTSRQVCDQKLVGGNLALERSMYYGLEVRVIRGIRYEGSATGKVYVYDGLYKIAECWFDVGKSGFGVYKYKLCRIEGQPKMGSAILKEARDIRKSGLDFKPEYCLSVDISNKLENIAVRLFNDIDDNRDPLYFEYLPKTTFPQFVFHQTGNTTGCDCVNGCADGCFCSMKNGGEFPYTQQGCLVRGKPLIFECGPFCTCPPNCRNRVAQKGIKNRLEVFRSRQTDWGVRSLDLIHAGTFICEYTGVVLTREQAQILTMNGDSLIYPNRFSERWAEWGDLSQIYSDYVRPSYPSIPPLDFSLDVSTMRNVACYISHSSSPNVLVQFVLYDHNNLMFPHLMLFAMENIPPMRELSIDYGVADEWTGKLSICN